MKKTDTPDAPKSKTGPLFLVGLGLCDENDLPLRSLEALKGCQSIFAEQYTNLMREGTLERLEEKINEEGKGARKIVLLAREEVEGEKKILDACSLGPVALLVPGDPMSATTHNSLAAAAREKNIQVGIFHASSIFSAAPGAAGLQAYKMGKTATITYWRKNYEPVAFLDVITENLERGAHTLCLLDIDPELGPMKPSLALEIIGKAQEKRKKDTAAERSPRAGSLPVLLPSTRLFVLCRVGWPDEKIWAGELKDWKTGMDEKLPGPCALIVCAGMHFVEEEAFRRAGRSFI
ncbi:MAG: diphthine synthase [Candidatus Micrarchaeota archaeon]